MNGRLVKCCEYCGGPDHEIGLCRAVAAVEYRSGDTVKRVEFNRDPSFTLSHIDWLDASSGLTAMQEDMKSCGGTDSDWAELLAKRRREHEALRDLGIVR